jgi:hypothetical protein
MFSGCSPAGLPTAADDIPVSSELFSSCLLAPSHGLLRTRTWTISDVQRASALRTEISEHHKPKRWESNTDNYRVAVMAITKRRDNWRSTRIVRIESVKHQAPRCGNRSQGAEQGARPRPWPLSNKLASKLGMIRPGAPTGMMSAASAHDGSGCGMVLAPAASSPSSRLVVGKSEVEHPCAHLP